MEATQETFTPCRWIYIGEARPLRAVAVPNARLGTATEKKSAVPRTPIQ